MGPSTNCGLLVDTFGSAVVLECIVNAVEILPLDVVSVEVKLYHCGVVT